MQMIEKVKLHFSLVTEGSKFLPLVCEQAGTLDEGKCGHIHALPFSV